MTFSKKEKKRKGQIAIIITLAIAAIFLFIAVFINIYKVSNVKLSTAKAADKYALELASQIGSMSHAYWVALGNSAGPVCVWSVSWWTLAKLFAVAVLTIAAFLMIPHPAILLTGFGLFTSMAMTNAISQSFQQMSLYNGLRERTLFGALSSVQTDDVMLNRYHNLGTYFEDINNNGLLDPSEPTYILSAIPEMLNPTVRKVDRFSAWYYTKRLPLVPDPLQAAIDRFFNDPIEGLKRYLVIGPWDPITWIITNVAYVIEPTSGGLSNYTVTSSALSWVVDRPTNKVRMLQIDGTNPYTDITWRPPVTADSSVGGYRTMDADSFLTTKLYSLLIRLEADYNLSFCNGTICNDVDLLIKDLMQFMAKSKEALEIPINLRLSTISQWFPSFYDFNHHCDFRRSKVGNTCNPDPYTYANLNTMDDDYKYDVYLRLWRDQVHIQRWINELENLNNNTIKPGIISNHGSYCRQGRGGVYASCYTGIQSCACNHTECDDTTCWIVCDGDACTNWQPVLFWGDYASCTGSGNDYTQTPVCSGLGDLYFATPTWCTDLRPYVNCVSHSDSCDSCSFTTPNNTLNPLSTHYPPEFFYQGQFSWRDDSVSYYDGRGRPTEVRQAIELLGGLIENLRKIQMTIAHLADAIESQSANALRNEIIYAWTDKRTDKPQYSHLVRVRINAYPEKLPYVSETIQWGGIQKCRELFNYTGDFELVVSRYDEDQPTDYWTLRRRKATNAAQFNTVILRQIVNDIQTTGRVDPARQTAVDNILNNYAIESSTQVHYGPDKADIHITGTPK